MKLILWFRQISKKYPAMKWMAGILGVLSLTGCDTQKTGRILTEEKLHEVKVDSIVKLSVLIHDKADSVCVLHPYQEKISEKFYQHVSVNKYLQDIKYLANESHWSLVVLNADATNIYTFKRSKILDIFDAYGLKSTATVNLPANFEMAECASFDQAALFKTAINDRIYMIFGSVK